MTQPSPHSRRTKKQRSVIAAVVVVVVVGEEPAAQKTSESAPGDNTHTHTHIMCLFAFVCEAHSHRTILSVPIVVLLVGSSDWPAFNWPARYDFLACASANEFLVVVVVGVVNPFFGRCFMYHTEPRAANRVRWT